MIARNTMLKIRGLIDSLQKQGVDLSAAKVETISPLLNSPVISTERLAAMILSVFRGHTTDEDVLWHHMR